MIALVALQFSMLASYVSKAVPGQALVSHGWLHIVRIATRRHLILYHYCSIIKVSGKENGSEPLTVKGIEMTLFILFYALALIPATIAIYRVENGLDFGCLEDPDWYGKIFGD